MRAVGHPFFADDGREGVFFMFDCSRSSVNGCDIIPSMHHFNTGGPCDPRRNYMLPATEWLDMPAIQRLIRDIVMK